MKSDTPAATNPSDQLKVYDPDRDIVARSSDTIELTGDSAEVGAYAGLACAPAADGQVFLVQSMPRITARE